MIAGAVTADLAALISVVLRGTKGQEVGIDCLVDTGFDGHLSIPTTLIHELGYSWQRRQEAELADGRREFFDVYRGLVHWDGRLRSVEVDAVDAQPLLGMGLMRDFKLEIEAKPGGAVMLNPLI